MSSPVLADSSVIDAQLERAKEAQKELGKLNQEQIDYIFAEVSRFMNKQRLPLAKLAVEETGLGQVEDKVLKNAFAAEYTYNAYKDMKTVGLLRHDTVKGIDEVAFPVGPIAAILPTTNPTSTVIAKTLMALKAGNSIVHLPHPRARKCSALAAKLAQEAAVAAGAPDGCITCVDATSVDVTKYVLSHPCVRFILATGGPHMVKAAYSAGKPALGVGAGNSPVIVDEFADREQAVSSIVLGKTFDNGTICASEQSTVVLECIYDEVKALMVRRGVYFVEGEDRSKLSAVILKNGNVNADIVGQTAKKIAAVAGIEVPAWCVVLGAEATEIGDSEPLSHEKLSPVLTLYKAKDFEEALVKAEQLLDHGGRGHTAVYHTNEQTQEDRIRRFEEVMPACHLIINMPASAGAIGMSYNFNVNPSLTLGCGTEAGSSASSNVSPMHLINIKRSAVIRDHIEWFKVPNMYFNRNCTAEALKDLLRPHASDKHRDTRVFVVTDKMMVQLGYIKELEEVLSSMNMSMHVFDNVAPDPTITTVLEGVAVCKAAQPDVMITIGGGSPLDAAKLIRVLYEHPELELKDLATRFLELRQRTSAFPELGNKIRRFIAIPTTSGTGSEVSPFSVITDVDGTKYPLCSYRMTPDIAIIDARYCDKLPRALIANAGFDALVHAVESHVSVFASEFTMPLSHRSSKLVFDHLALSFNDGNHKSREAIHNAAAIAGMAFSNAFLGINHSMSHALGGAFHLPHGLANAVLFDYVIRYNSDPAPTRMAAFPQYKYPQSLQRYSALARTCGVAEGTEEQMVEGFIAKAAELRDAIGLPHTIQGAGVDEKAFLAQVDALAEKAFDDQCTGTNPRFPLIHELKELFLHAYYGTQAKLV